MHRLPSSVLLLFTGTFQTKQSTSKTIFFCSSIIHLLFALCLYDVRYSFIEYFICCHFLLLFTIEFAYRTSCYHCIGHETAHSEHTAHLLMPTAIQLQFFFAATVTLLVNMRVCILQHNRKDQCIKLNWNTLRV